jgi:subtilisin family serine protease
VTVAVVDSGLQLDHPDLQDNLVVNGSYNFAYPNNGQSIFDPSHSTNFGDHGTAVAGIIAARGGNEEGLWGVAPAAQLKGFNFLSAENDELLLYALGKPPTTRLTGLRNQDVDVFNLSFGSAPVIERYAALDFQNRMSDMYQHFEWAAQNLRNGRGAIYLKAGRK